MSKKAERFELRIEPEVKALAQLRAAEQGVTTSEYIRLLIQRDNGLIRETCGNEAMDHE
jgi:predicted HicB family RNase H-like nuclease